MLSQVYASQVDGLYRRSLPHAADLDAQDHIGPCAADLDVQVVVQ